MTNEEKIAKIKSLREGPLPLEEIKEIGEEVLSSVLDSLQNEPNGSISSFHFFNKAELVVKKRLSNLDNKVGIEVLKNRLIRAAVNYILAQFAVKPNEVVDHNSCFITGFFLKSYTEVKLLNSRLVAIYAENGDFMRFGWAQEKDIFVRYQLFPKAFKE